MGITMNTLPRYVATVVVLVMKLVATVAVAACVQNVGEAEMALAQTVAEAETALAEIVGATDFVDYAAEPELTVMDVLAQTVAVMETA